MVIFVLTALLDKHYNSNKQNKEEEFNLNDYFSNEIKLDLELRTNSHEVNINLASKPVEFDCVLKKGHSSIIKLLGVRTRVTSKELSH